jgi:hypothetical protein
MRLKMSLTTSDEELLRLVNDGYAMLQMSEREYERRAAKPRPPKVAATGGRH